MQLDDHESNLREMSGLGVSDRYRLIKLIGRGGMGSIYEADDVVLNDKVAIKVLHRDLCSTADSRIRFLREAKALAALRHSNIVNIRYLGVTEQGRPFQVLDYLDGETLADRNLRTNSPLSPREFQRIFVQVADALEYARQRNVVHRDIKPSNIMLRYVNEETHAILLDFGIAKIIDEDPEKTVTGMTIPGSPPYMSPEQCRGESLDFRSDMYSLGCVMYECLAMAQPFSGETHMEIMYKHFNEEPPLLQMMTESGNKAPSLVVSVIERCLAKDKERRPESFTQLKELLLESTTGESVYRVTAGGGARGKYGRHSAILLTILALVLAGGVASLMNRRTAPEPALASVGGDKGCSKELERLIVKTKKSMRQIRMGDASGQKSAAVVLSVDMPELALRFARAHRFAEAVQTLRDWLTVCSRLPEGAGAATVNAHKVMADVYSWWAAEDGGNQEGELLKESRAQYREAVQQARALSLHEEQSEAQSLLVRKYCAAGLIPESKAEFASFAEGLKHLKQPSALAYISTSQPTDHRTRDALEFAKDLPGTAKPKSREDVLTLCQYCLTLADYAVSIGKGECALEILPIAQSYLDQAFPKKTDRLSALYVQPNAQIEHLHKEAERAKANEPHGRDEIPFLGPGKSCTGSEM